MNSFLEFESIDQAQKWIFSELIRSGKISTPRGLVTRELLFVSFKITNPRMRYTSLKGRHWSLPLAIGEYCWHVRGSDDLESIAWYAPRWADFSDDGKAVRGSSYGKIIFGSGYGKGTPWERVLSTLRNDSESRRAILYLEGAVDRLPDQTKDFPCAVSLQFFIRDARLHAVGSMRSNDVVWGVPYDVFLFTMLQERMALELGIELGAYYHIANSMHIYERHFPLGERLATELPLLSLPMENMGSADQFPTVLGIEKRIRETADEALPTEQLDKYWKDLLAVLLWYKKSINPSPLSGNAGEVKVDNFLYRGLLDPASIDLGGSSQVY